MTPSNAKPGDVVTYKITLLNDGSGHCVVPLVIRELLPAGFTYDSLVSAKLGSFAHLGRERQFVRPGQTGLHTELVHHDGQLARNLVQGTRQLHATRWCLYEPVHLPYSGKVCPRELWHL